MAISGVEADADAEARLELRSIAEIMARARGEIAALRPRHPHEAAPCADVELEAITRDTAMATHAILSAAEAMMACDTADFAAYRTEVQAQAQAIFEACAFQDITGQRVAKVLAALRDVEARVGRSARASGSSEGGEPIHPADAFLTGPAPSGPATSQATIDLLFAEPSVRL